MEDADTAVVGTSSQERILPAADLISGQRSSRLAGRQDSHAGKLTNEPHHSDPDADPLGSVCTVCWLVSPLAGEELACLPAELRTAPRGEA